MTKAEKEAIVQSLKAFEPLTAMIPAPGNLVMLAIMHVAEDAINSGLDPDTLEQLRAGVYDRLQDRLAAKFGGGT